MFITFRKWTLIYILCLTTLVIGFTLILQRGTAVPTANFTTVDTKMYTLIIDPGHGGEDGGAVSSDGTIESQINLSVGILSADLARFLGWEVCMTRDQDISIHDENAQTLREKKVSDLKNRVSLCEQIRNGILLSIHQNSLPSAKSVRGAQVFFNDNSGSAELAQVIQTALNQTVNQSYTKAPKRIGDASYLMKHVSITAVLIECGFLSNDTDTQLLRSGEYQKKLAVCIIAASAEHLSKTENFD